MAPGSLLPGVKWLGALRLGFAKHSRAAATKKFEFGGLQPRVVAMKIAVLLICACCLCTARASEPAIYRGDWNDLDKNGKKEIYEDPAQPIPARVADLHARMTLGEVPKGSGERAVRRISPDSECRAGRGPASRRGAVPGPPSGRRAATISFWRGRCRVRR